MAPLQRRSAAAVRGGAASVGEEAQRWQCLQWACAGRGAPGGAQKPSLSIDATAAASIEASGNRGAPGTRQMTPMAGRTLHGAQRPVPSADLAAALMRVSCAAAGGPRQEG